MKKVILMFSLFVGLVSINGIPIVGNEKNVFELALPKEVPEITQVKIKVNKHNLNSRQLRNMSWLRYVDKV